MRHRLLQRTLTVKRFMKKSSFIFLVCLAALSHFCFAQNLKWNPPVKIADRIHQTYLGYNGSTHYSMGSNIKMTYDKSDSLYPAPNWKKLKLTLFRYDDKFVLKDTVPVRFFATPKRYFEAVKTDLGICLFYTKGVTSTLTFCADLFDWNGKFIETKTLASAIDLASFKLMEYYQLNVSPSKKCFSIISTDSILCYNFSFESLWKTAFKHEKCYSSLLTDQAQFYAALAINRQDKLIGVNEKGEATTQTIGSVLEQNDSYSLEFNHDKVFVFSLYGTKDKSYNPDYEKAGNYTRFRSNGLRFSVFSASLDSLKTQIIAYTNQTLLDAVPRVMLQNIKGIDWVSISQVDFGDDGDAILLLEKKYAEPTPSKPVQGSKVELEGRLNHGKELIVIKTSEEGKNNQVVIKREMLCEENFEYVMNVKAIPTAKGYFVYFHEGSNETNYMLKEVVLNNSLRTLFTAEVNLVDNKKPFLNLHKAGRIDKNNYLVFGRISKKIASAILDFK